VPLNKTYDIINVTCQLKQINKVKVISNHSKKNIFLLTTTKQMLPYVQESFLQLLSPAFPLPSQSCDGILVRNKIHFCGYIYYYYYYVVGGGVHLSQVFFSLVLEPMVNPITQDLSVRL
jgi:hypothetical protein